MADPLRIGIDASNLRRGGGMSHLVEILAVADPDQHNFERATVWGGQETLEKLPQDRPWLDLRDHAWLNSGSLKRVAWRKRHLPHELTATSTLLFAPGGLIAATDLPSVTMCRNMLPFDARERARTGFGLARLRFEALKRAQTSSFMATDGLIFLTEYARSEVMEQMPKPPRLETVVAHGVNSRFAQTPKPQREMSEYSEKAPFRLFYASSVNVYKHQWVVVEAVAALRQQGYPIRLDLAGAASDKPSAARLRACIAEHDPDSTFIHWAGSVPFTEMHDLYRNADGCIFASSCENLPNILLESMSAGLPILSTDRGPMPDVLGEKGFYFDVDEQGALQTALTAMLDNPKARALAAEDAYGRAQDYSWQTCADKTFAFLNRVASAQ